MGMNPEQQPPPYGGQYPPPPPPPPQYGGQYPQSPPPPIMQQPPNRWGPTSLGMDANAAAGLSYIPIIGLIFFFVEKTNRFVKFHAAQAILVAIAWIVVDIVLGIVESFFRVGTSVAGTGATLAVDGLFSCVNGIIGLCFLGVLVWGLINGFTDKYVKFPVVGDIAERWAGGPAIPMY